MRMEFLRVALADGERPATEVLHEATALGTPLCLARGLILSFAHNDPYQCSGCDG